MIILVMIRHRWHLAFDPVQIERDEAICCERSEIPSEQRNQFFSSVHRCARQFFPTTKAEKHICCSILALDCMRNSSGFRCPKTLDAQSRIVSRRIAQMHAITFQRPSSLILADIPDGIRNNRYRKTKYFGLPFRDIKKTLNVCCGPYDWNKALSLSIFCQTLSRTACANAPHIASCGYSRKNHDSSLLHEWVELSLCGSSNRASKSREITIRSAFWSNVSESGTARNWNLFLQTLSKILAYVCSPICRFMQRVLQETNGRSDCM